MKLYQKYLIRNYLKNFFVIFVALEFFYLGIDLLTTYQKLPKSANLQILYTMFESLYAINFVLPLSVIFAMIATTVSMIKSNELVSLRALGVSRQSFTLPIFFSALAIIVIYISLTFTPFSYAREYSVNILQHNQISTNTEGLFLKNNNDYIYFEKFYPIKKEASHIKIYHVQDMDLQYVLKAQKGYYQEKNWVLYHVEKIIKPKAETLDGKGLIIQKFSKLETLKDFRPKIIDNIYKGKTNLSVLDAMDALKFFNAQGLDTNRLKTIILSQLFIPLFAPLLILIFSSRTPLISRYYNTTLISFVLIFISLATWGLLFLFSKLAMNTVILPEVAIIIPMLSLGIFSLYSHFKE